MVGEQCDLWEEVVALPDLSGSALEQHDLMEVVAGQHDPMVVGVERTDLQVVEEVPLDPLEEAVASGEAGHLRHTSHLLPSLPVETCFCTHH